MLAVPIGRFNQEIIGILDGSRVAQDQRIIATQIAGKNHAHSFAVARDACFHDGGTEDMPRIHKPDLGPVGELRGFVIVNRLEMPHSLFGVFGGKQRQRRFVFAEFHLIGEARIFFLQVRRIQEADLAQLGCHRSGQNLSVKSFPHEDRQHAGVVDVCMSQKHVIDGCRRNHRRFPVQQAELFRPLKHAAIHQKTSLSRVDQIF